MRQLEAKGSMNDNPLLKNASLANQNKNNHFSGRTDAYSDIPNLYSYVNTYGDNTIDLTKNSKAFKEEKLNEMDRKNSGCCGAGSSSRKSKRK